MPAPHRVRVLRDALGRVADGEEVDDVAQRKRSRRVRGQGWIEARGERRRRLAAITHEDVPLIAELAGRTGRSPSRVRHAS